MQRPIVYVGFGGGDIANYWPASYVSPAVTEGQFIVEGDLTPQFRYFNVGKSLNYEVAVVVASGFQPAWARSRSGIIGQGLR